MHCKSCSVNTTVTPYYTVVCGSKHAQVMGNRIHSIFHYKVMPFQPVSLQVTDVNVFLNYMCKTSWAGADNPMGSISSNKWGFYYSGHLLWTLIVYGFFMISYMRGGLQRGKFWASQEAIITLIICCKFQKILHRLFHDFIHVYSRRARADNLGWQNS